MKPECIVFNESNNTVTIADFRPEQDVFWVEIAGGEPNNGVLDFNVIGWLRFDCVAINQNGSGDYLLNGLRLASETPPYPVISLSGVLWSRRAAIEAHRSISAYQQGLNRIHQSCERLDVE